MTLICALDLITMGHNLSRLSFISIATASSVDQLASKDFEQFVTGNERTLVSCASLIRLASKKRC